MSHNLKNRELWKDTQSIKLCKLSKAGLSHMLESNGEERYKK